MEIIIMMHLFAYSEFAMHEMIMHFLISKIIDRRRVSE